MLSAFHVLSRQDQTSSSRLLSDAAASHTPGPVVLAGLQHVAVVSLFLFRKKCLKGRLAFTKNGGNKTAPGIYNGQCHRSPLALGKEKKQDNVCVSPEMV